MLKKLIIRFVYGSNGITGAKKKVHSIAKLIVTYKSAVFL